MSTSPAARPGPRPCWHGPGDAAGEDRVRASGPPARSSSGRRQPGHRSGRSWWTAGPRPAIPGARAWQGTAIRGTSVTPPDFRGQPLRSDVDPAGGPHRPSRTDQQAWPQDLRARFGDAVQPAESAIATCPPLSATPGAHRARSCAFSRTEAEPRFQRLEDLTAVDESARRDPDPIRITPWSITCCPLSRPARLRLKVPAGRRIPWPASITDIWPSANWYEREVFDMFGIRFDGHPNLRRLLMPHDWRATPCARAIPAGPPKCRPTPTGCPWNASPWTPATLRPVAHRS